MRQLTNAMEMLDFSQTSLDERVYFVKTLCVRFSSVLRQMDGIDMQRRHRQSSLGERGVYFLKVRPFVWRNFLPDEIGE